MDSKKDHSMPGRLVKKLEHFQHSGETKTFFVGLLDQQLEKSRERLFTYMIPAA